MGRGNSEQELRHFKSQQIGAEEGDTYRFILPGGLFLRHRASPPTRGLCCTYHKGERGYPTRRLMYSAEEKREIRRFFPFLFPSVQSPRLDRKDIFMF